MENNYFPHPSVLFMPDSTSASKVFNTNAQAYDTYRPKCPPQVVEHLQQWAQLGPQNRCC